MEIAPLVSVSWLSENIENPNLIILDASPKENKSNLIPEFTDIQIKGARKFDMDEVFLDKNNPIPNMMPSAEVFTKECQKLGISKESILVVYDNLGIYTSPRVWWMFKVMGHSQIAVLDGGLSAWIQANLPTEPISEVNVKQGNFMANYNSALIVDSDFLLKNIQQHSYQVIDARSSDRFNGSIPEPRENMASGHIPNSLNLPFKLVLNEGKMKSQQELITLFKNLSITNEPLVFTCGSGVTACILMLASEIAIKNTKALYDGSWSEWGKLGKFPVQN